MIDLRSDTVTRPSSGMRKSMLAAEVGDDVLGDDPTVGELESRMAELTGKEAALYVVSGTMANLLSLVSQTRRGDEVLMDRNCHIFNYEAAGSAVIGGLQLHPFDREDGFLPLEELPAAVRPENVHHPRTSLVCVENTHNRAGGSIYPFEMMQQVYHFARENGLRVHLDGARLPNAVAETGIPFDKWSSLADSVNICFSKGLGAPVGSVLLSDRETVTRARFWRKRLGGGWRQAGILAAACLYAIEKNVERLKEDHMKAREIADFIADIPGFKLVRKPDTNIVIFQVERGTMDACTLVEKLEEKGILALAFGGNRIRMVTHLDVSFDDIEFFKENFPGT
ncbi:MAG: low-specificity L-threonine aldolase [Candidatus Latescibacteria bacterium]|nr:low-specificity L-threonine aldolase [bacterium]MBD3423174.1 low-specificity L-threonine aldolase [Candidatus Latescibacterota bacterium]